MFVKTLYNYCGNKYEIEYMIDEVWSMVKTYASWGKESRWESPPEGRYIFIIKVFGNLNGIPEYGIDWNSYVIDRKEFWHAPLTKTE